MSINYNALAIPKGKTRTQIKARKDREDAKQLKAFRDAVWAREGARYSPTADTQDNWARCQHCGYSVVRLRDGWMTGEVHHRIFRGNTATRYDPANGVLLCNHLVNNCHEKAERKLIDV